MNTQNKPFEGMNDKQSSEYQLSQWVEGNPLHNPIRDECCPDFSCCDGNMMDSKTRKRFSDAYKSGDRETQYKILAMALSGLIVDTSGKVHIADRHLKKD